MTESVLDIPLRANRDADEFVRAAMEWHFNPDTGSPFWLRKATTFGFDPRTDVKSHDDLALFPNVVNELRDVPVGDLVPKGYGATAPILGVYESGGTTGAPKRVVILRDWWDQVFAEVGARLDDRGFPRNVNWLTMTPNGPHVIGDTMTRHALDRGGVAFTIDLDPRWVRKLIGAGRTEEADAYTDHLIAQAAFVLRTQDVGVLMTTPPMLSRLARHDDLIDLINQKVSAILWGGAHLDADTRDLLRTDVFPNVELCGAYGSTMIGGGPTIERPGVEESVFDPLSPAVTFSVIDPATSRPVAYGERGQVVMHHVSRSMLLPNNLERDEATRAEPLPGLVGDAVADVSPVPVFENEAVIEGVY